LAHGPRERPKDAKEFAALLSDVLPAVA
jgi:hypothetical protein